VHRDLKPENVFIVRDSEAQGGERPKILDFGIAKLSGDVGGDRKRTQTGLLLGTPIYMSPEQCRGSGAVDHRADVYALGCVLYHQLTGHPPFDLDGVGEIISAHLRETPRPPSALAVGIPASVDVLVLRCLAKDPDERFQSMLELQQACEAQLARISSGGGAPTIALANLPTVIAPGAQTTMGAAAGQVTPVRAARRRGMWLAVATVALAGAAIAVVALRGGSAEQAPVNPAASAPVAAIDAGVVVDAPVPDASIPDAPVPEAMVPIAVPPKAAPVRVHVKKRAAAPHAPTRPAEDPYDIR
jgi:serine/threonine-protein kinase